MNELAAAMAEILDGQGIDEGGFDTPVPGLRLVRAARKVPPRHMVYRASLCIIGQGRKHVFSGETVLDYGPMQSLLVTVDLPVLSEISEASAEHPFIGGTLDLDLAVLTQVALRLEGRPAAGDAAHRGLLVGEMDRHLAAAVLRLLALVKRPEAIEMLYPLIMQEICYWLLAGPQGEAIARMALPNGQTMRIARAVNRLREAYASPVSVAELADLAAMSVSSFHKHFRTVTAMSPLQYQKTLRLLEARRQILAEGTKAGVAAFAVGYESVSQFSREYSRMFGRPPGRDAQAARTTAEAPRPARRQASGPGLRPDQAAPVSRSRAAHSLAAAG